MRQEMKLRQLFWATAFVALPACVAAPAPPGSPATATPTDASPSVGTVAPSSSPSTTPAAVELSRFEGEGFTFDYPGHWRLISGYKHAGLHGPTVLAAVGIGDFDLGCTSTVNEVTCSAGPSWTVPDDGVVLAYRFGAWLGPIHPQPTPNLGPGDEWVEVAGRAAVLSRTDTSMTWHFPGAPEFIEARWGPGIAEAARSEVTTVIASWVWSPGSRPTG